MPCSSEKPDVSEEHITTFRIKEEAQAINQQEAGGKQSTSNLGRVIDKPA
jgi:hypothetical protein